MVKLREMERELCRTIIMLTVFKSSHLLQTQKNIALFVVGLIIELWGKISCKAIIIGVTCKKCSLQHYN